MKVTPKLKEGVLVKVVLTLLVISYLAFVHFRGIIFSDEGYILNSAWRMINGQVPYRDFDMVYTPVSFVSVLGAFKLLGVSVFSGRVLMVFFSTITFGVIFKLIRRFSKSFILASLGGLVYLVWGPGQINFPWPTMFAITFGTLATYFLVKREATAVGTVLAGFFAVTTFLAKQNLGVGLLIADGLLLLVLTRKKLPNFLIGVMGGLSIWFFYLLVNGAVVGFISNLYFHTFQKIVVEGTISTPFVTPGTNGVATLGKVMFYLLPAVSAILAIFLTIKTKRLVLLPIPVLGIMFYILGIRPVTDYNHFVPLLALSGMSLAVVIRLAKKPITKLSAITLLVMVTGLGFYRSLWAGYYRWGEPLLSQDVYIPSDRVKVWATADNLKQVTDLELFFDKNTKKNEKIFVNVYLPMVYFVVNRQNATRFDYFSDTATSKRQQQEMIGDLKANKIRFVVNNRLNLNQKSELSRFFESEFDSVGEKGTFVFLKSH